MLRRARSLAGVLLAVTLLFVAVPAGARTDLAATVTIRGEVRDDGFGGAVASAGDVNADGFVDFVAAAGGDDDVAEGSGQAYLFYGPLTSNISARNADASVTGEDLVDGLGSSVAGAGDVNGDGFDDLLIGARSNDTNGIQAGRAYLFYGPLAGTYAALEADAIISGDPFDEMGWSVAPAGDVNGDGLDDVLVGAWMADLVGQAFLYLGPLSGELTEADADAGFTGVIFSELLGDAVAAGDLNDDGVPDLILGAPRPPLNGNDPGRAYVFFGPVTGTFLASQADVILSGEQDNDEFGTAVAAGDIDGDGAEDLIVGAHQLFSRGTGKAYLFYGPLAGNIPAGEADAVMVGEDSSQDDLDLFGEAVAAAGDTNGDDFDDVLVGAPTNYSGGVRSGRVYLFHGPLAGTIQAAAADHIFTGSTFDLLGSVVAPAGDGNGDGLADYLAGAPQFFGENAFGYATLFFGEGVAATGPKVVLTPIDPPIVIPPQGGRVRFDAEMTNRSGVALDLDFWTELEAPGGGLLTSSPRSLTLEAGESVTVRVVRRIPGGAPAGTYTLRGLVGAFPVAEDSDTFTFVKSGAG